MITNWHASSLKFAARIGLRTSNVPIATLKSVRGLLQGGNHYPEEIGRVPVDVCCCVENPTAMMEKQDYMQVKQPLQQMDF